MDSSLTVFVVLGTQSSPTLHDRIRMHTDTTRPSLIDLRRDLHRHPEASGQEVRTARMVAEPLRDRRPVWSAAAAVIGRLTTATGTSAARRIPWP